MNGNQSKRKIIDVLLVSDDTDCDTDNDSIIFVDRKRKKKSNRYKNENACINPNCSSGLKPITKSPEFVSNYYRVTIKKSRICSVCFEEAGAYFVNLNKEFMSGNRFIDMQGPPSNNVVNIDSNSEEESLTDEDNDKLDKDTVELFDSEFSNIYQEICKKYKIDDVLTDFTTDLNNSCDAFEKTESKKKSELDRSQKLIDDIRIKLYKPFQPIFQNQPGIEIIGEIPDLNQTVSDARRIDKVSDETGVVVPVQKVSTGTQSDPIDTAETFVIFDDPNDILKNADVKPVLKKETMKHETDEIDVESYCQDVVAVSEEIMNPPASLPSPGNMVLPRLHTGNLVYAEKKGYQLCWREGTVSKVEENGYWVQLQTSNDPLKFLNPNKLAFRTASPVRLTVGVRVIAIYRDVQIQETNKQRKTFYSGVIAEPPKPMNQFRYLVFFDDGYTQYVNHGDIRVICKQPTNGWDDTPPESKEFIKKYLSEYPERPMVKLQKGDEVKVEYKLKWWMTEVEEIDCSLAKMVYLGDPKKRMEWVYRGSTRLAPLFEELNNARRRKQAGERVRRITMSNLRKNMQKVYVEYTHTIDLDDEDDKPEAATDFKVVTRKSSSRDDRKKFAKLSSSIIPYEIIPRTLTDTLTPNSFTRHQCEPKCIEWTKYTFQKSANYGQIAIPLYFGFRRVMSRSGDKRVLSYIAPCGRRLRNMDEVHLYLRVTKSQKTVDMFNFDHWVDCLKEFKIKGDCVFLPDLSHGKELNRISCVNSVNYLIPDFPGYMTWREPREDVPLNLDEEFLCGCDCTDDCKDKSKCACWKLTIQGQELIGGTDIDPNVGYHYRRLQERVLTGIYECNNRCKCSKVTCLNRVVQHPLPQKLQLFRTHMKGWGIRCLNDIPQGAFICIYVGHLLSERAANEEGKKSGDEYFAELDYIESMENMKEGYESDVPEYSSDVKSSSESSSESDHDDISDLEDKQHMMTSPGIRGRLRARKTKFDTQVSEASKSKKASKQLFSEPSKKLKPKEHNTESIRKYFGEDETAYVMDAKYNGNIGRYLNHSCDPNVFVQNVFVDTHDLRFPWVAFFALKFIEAGSELTWDYNYTIGSVEGKSLRCHCGTSKCRGRLL